MEKMNARLSEFNSILKENDEIYRDIAKAFGMSDCTFWILYSIRENENPLTQSEICSLLFQAKQTVNSALKKMESDGYIELAYNDNRRSKQILLTKKGIELAKKTVDIIIMCENEALEGLTEQEHKTFIMLFRRYTSLLRNSMQGVEK